MPTKNNGRGKPWRARVKLGGRTLNQDVHLGLFDIWSEARAAEDAFWARRGGRNRYPQLRNSRGQFV